MPQTMTAAQEITTAELEALRFAPGICSPCGEKTSVYHDSATGEYLCLSCLEGAVDAEAAAVDAEEWDWIHTENGRLSQEDIARFSYPAPFC